MTDLCTLAKHHGTDKYPYYTPLYHALLDARRPFVRSVLEIGIGTKAAMGHVPNYQPGASLRMWRDYFPNAWVFGVDKSADAMFEDFAIRTIQIDQAEPGAIRRWAGFSANRNFNLILDDGSHDPQDQVNTAVALMPLLAPGGLYIIEDVNDPEAVSAALPFRNSVIRTHYNALEGRLVLVDPTRK